MAATVSALAAALGQMVLRYSLGRKSLAEHDSLHQHALNELTKMSQTSLNLAEADAAAYAHLNELWKLDKHDPRRAAEWSDAVTGAIAAPRQLLETCLAMLRILRELPRRTNRMLDSDLAIAAILAEAGARSAAWNVRINLPLLDDASARQRLQKDIDASLNEAQSACQAIDASCIVPEP